MSSESESLPLPSIDDIKNYVQSWPTNAGNALKGTFSNLGIREYIRLVWIIGGYMILRPYLEKLFKFLFDRGQAKRRAEEEEDEDEDGQPRMSANELRGVSSGVDYDGEGDDDEDAKPAVPQWGRAARLRQKKAMQLIEEEYARRQEEEDDKDIADLLED